MATGEQQEKIVNNAEEVESCKRTHTTIIIEILLRAEQINDFKKRLEDLKKEFMNSKDLQ